MEGQWLTCDCDHDYEIYSEYPYSIRRKDNDKLISESISNKGYYQYILNGVVYPKHRIIAYQFIHNNDPINKKYVDHINHIKTDNRVENLRWVSPSENTKNRSYYKNYNYEYFDIIDDDCIIVDKYGKHDLEDIYYDANTDIFYFFNGIKYRKIPILYTKYGYAYVNVIDKNHRQTRIYYNKFKKQYNLI